MKSLLTNSLPIKKIISINIQKWFFGKGEKIIPAFSSTNPERTPAGEAEDDHEG